VHDFLIERTNRTIHICNAPSPAATSAIPIGQHVAEQAEAIMAEVGGTAQKRSSPRGPAAASAAGMHAG
jgi:L-2-hydroxyglutarate oxidase LhgO